MTEFEFIDERFMSADEKHKVIRAWARFLKGGCQKEHFTKALYHHLTQHCMFIAHYDIYGFYGYYFECQPSTTIRFLRQFDKAGRCLSAEMGVDYWRTGQYNDINQAMIDVGVGYIPQLIVDAAEGQCIKDVTEAHRLLAKHGLAVPDVIIKQAANMFGEPG